jgi:hypothetical protein
LAKSTEPTLAKRGNKKETVMKKMMTLVVLTAIMAMVLSGCATRISRPGMQVTTNDPNVASQAADPKVDYTNGIAEAIAANIKANASVNTNTGNNTANNGAENASRGKKMMVVFENWTSYNIMVESRVAEIPGVNINTLLSNSISTIIPGYEPQTFMVPKNGYYVAYYYASTNDITITKLTGNTRAIVDNYSLRIDVQSAHQYSQKASAPCDYVFWYAGPARRH